MAEQTLSEALGRELTSQQADLVKQQVASEILGRDLTTQEIELVKQRGISEIFNQALTEQQVKSEESERQISQATARLGALRDFEDTRLNRQQVALNALIQAAPFLVGPEDQFFPGLEPGGAGQVLGDLLGADVQPREIPTADLGLDALLSAPILGGPSEIDRLLSGTFAGGQ